MVEKCKYYNDSQTACSLMIDDLVPVSVSDIGGVSARNDWGYLKDDENSLYAYFDRHLLNKYPEIKGTFFLPLSSQNHISTDNGYVVMKEDVDSPQFLSFIDRISSRFEMAFHGDKHEFTNKKGESVHEFANITPDHLITIANRAREFLVKTGIQFSGGKFPGYNYNEEALEIIKELESKWWALQVNMINKVHSQNDIFFDENLKIIMMPTNISGDVFYYSNFDKQHKLKKMIKEIIGYKKYSDPIEYLHYLYENRFPITIQEHFQNQHTNGKRQTPNVYDDIFSLDMIYAFLRGKDIWYATCSEIAHCYESFLHSVINEIDDKTFNVIYSGIYSEPLLSIKLSSPKILHIETMKEIQGVFKNNDYWVFDNIAVGKYKIVD